MSSKPSGRRKAKDDEGDPVVARFLQFLETQMTDHPEEIVVADTDQLRRIGKLVKGVKIN